MSLYRDNIDPLHAVEQMEAVDELVAAGVLTPIAHSDTWPYCKTHGSIMMRGVAECPDSGTDVRNGHRPCEKQYLVEVETIYMPRRYR